MTEQSLVSADEAEGRQDELILFPDKNALFHHY